MSFGREWNQEFEALKAMQEDRMHLASSQACTEQCIPTLWTNTLLPWEQRCMKNCLQKYAESGLIMNFNLQRFDQAQAELQRRKK